MLSFNLILINIMNMFLFNIIIITSSSMMYDFNGTTKLNVYNITYKVDTEKY